MCHSLVFFAFSAAFMQVAFSQAIVPINSLLPNQLVINSLPNLVSLSPNLVSYETIDTVVKTPIVQAPIVQQPIVQTPIVQQPIVQAPVVPTTTIIQDSTVANNLANALQLLIVSNLLSNTLPYMGDVIVPNYASTLELVAPVSLGGLSYVF